MSYYDPPDDWDSPSGSCPHEDTGGYVLDSAGWQDWESSVWVEVWVAECGDCGMVWEEIDETERIEITAREEMEHAA